MEETTRADLDIHRKAREKFWLSGAKMNRLAYGICDYRRPRANALNRLAGRGAYQPRISLS